MATPQITSDEGIVLSALRYGENSLIVKILTQADGLRSCIVKQGRRKGGSPAGVLFQPLTHLAFQFVRGRGSNSLDTLREARLLMSPLHAAPGMLRSSVALFVADVLNQTIRHQEADGRLFEYLKCTVRQIVEAKEAALADSPLVFMVQLAGLLGFEPLPNFDTQHHLFDLMEGRFAQYATHGHYMPAEWAVLFYDVLMKCRGDVFVLNLPVGSRRMLLEFMIEYFQLQMPGMGEIKSHRVLREVMVG